MSTTHSLKRKFECLGGDLRIHQKGEIMNYIDGILMVAVLCVLVAPVILFVFTVVLPIAAIVAAVYYIVKMIIDMRGGDTHV